MTTNAETASQEKSFGEAMREFFAAVEEAGDLAAEWVREEGCRAGEWAEARVEEMKPGFRKAGERIEAGVVDVFHRLGLPHVDDLEDLGRRIDELGRMVEELRDAAADRADAPVVYHVVPDGDDWKVELEGSERAVSRHDTKKEALEAARSLAKERAPSRMVIHRQDGTIQTSHSYDPADG